MAEEKNGSPGSAAGDELARLRAENAYLSSLLEHHPDAIVVLERNGRFKLINSGLERLVGRAVRAPATMEELGELLVPDREYRAEAFRSWAADLASRHPPPHILAFRHAGGELRWGRFQQAHLPNGEILIAGVEFTEQKKQQQEAIEAKERYRALVLASPDAVTVTDLEGRIVEVSERAVECHGFDCAEQMIGLSAFDLIAPELRAQAAENLEDTLRDGRSWFEGEGVRKDGSRFVAELTASLVRDDAGAPIAFLGVTRDITTRKQAERALRARNLELARANEELARLQRAKDEFVATISHELRTPLVTGIGYVDLLLEGSLGKLAPRAISRMQVALRNLQRLSRLIDDLLQYNRVVHNTQRYSPALQKVDLSEVVDECVTALLTRTRRKRKSLEVELAEDLPRVLADPELLHTVIANLLDNADRHAGARSRIRVAASEAGGQVAISISDDGQGMEQEVRDRAFEPFHKSRESHEGLGLGLFIVHAILEAHGAEVKLESAPGEGTKVSFSLAMVPAPPPAP